jgi:uncharacterized protein
MDQRGAPLREASPAGGSAMIRRVAARVAWISIAPVKALGLVHPAAVRLGPSGVTADRRFLLLDADGRLVNGKRYGSLVRVSPAYDEELSELTLRFPDGSEVSQATGVGEPVAAELYGRPLNAWPIEGALAAALSAYVGEAVRLLEVAPPGTAVDRDSGGAVSLLSVASLQTLAEEAGVADQIDPRRFRMLFGIDGVEAHAEDGWVGRRVRIGEAVVVPEAPVGRCAVTTQHPETGVPDLDTLRVLGRYRADVPSEEPIPFGVWGRVERPGRVALGDPVALID